MKDINCPWIESNQDYSHPPITHPVPKCCVIFHGKSHLNVYLSVWIIFFSWLYALNMKTRNVNNIYGAKIKKISYFVHAWHCTKDYYAFNLDHTFNTGYMDMLLFGIWVEVFQFVVCYGHNSWALQSQCVRQNCFVKRFDKSEWIQKRITYEKKELNRINSVLMRYILWIKLFCVIWFHLHFVDWCIVTQQWSYF